MTAIEINEALTEAGIECEYLKNDQFVISQTVLELKKGYLRGADWSYPVESLGQIVNCLVFKQLIPNDTEIVIRIMNYFYKVI